MAGKAAFEDQQGYTSVLQQELEGLVGSYSVSRDSRSALTNSTNITVSNVVPDETKLQ